MTWDISVYSIVEDVDISLDKFKGQMEWLDLNERQKYTFPVSMDKIYQFIIG